MILGGDYSLYDNVLDWENHSWKFAFIKISEGIYEDRMFSLQWRAAEGHVYRGPYHFFRPLVPWRTAADKLLQLLSREGRGELPPVIDLEVTNGVSNEQVNYYGLEWVRYVHRELGVKPIVYTSPGFSNMIQMYRFPDWTDYPLWQATYPWDEISEDWSEQQRSDTIHAVIMGTQQYIFPTPARPWLDVGKSPLWAQWTGKCPPEYVPGYPLGHKKAVDVNFYRFSLQEMIYRFNLPPLEGDDDMSSKPITWTATLRFGQAANLRSGPGLSYSIKRTITASTTPVPFTGTGVKVPADNYFWGEVLTPEPGFIAFTTSFENVVWHETPPPPPAQRRAVGSRIFYDDNSHDDIGTVQP